MKKIIIPFLILSFFVATTSIAQSRTQLKGPAAKNYKPWQDNSKTSKTYLTHSVEIKQGPEAKNAKVWSKKNKSEEAIVINMTSKPQNLKGPEAKNRTPWAEQRSEELQVTEN
jgi:hypothetical protein